MSGFSFKDHLVVVVTARALFDCAESNDLFESKGLVAYQEHQRSRYDEPFGLGVGYPLVNALLSLNMPGKRFVEVRERITSKQTVRCAAQ